MLDILTFTGVDSHTSLDELARLAARYPKVEFGILVGSHTDRQDRRTIPMPLRPNIQPLSVTAFDMARARSP